MHHTVLPAAAGKAGPTNPATPEQTAPMLQTPHRLQIRAS